MKFFFGLLLSSTLTLGQTVATADVTIQDWRGASVSAREGSVDSDGVRIVYHTAGEGPLVIFIHSITGPWFDWQNQMVQIWDVQNTRQKQRKSEFGP